MNDPQRVTRFGIDTAEISEADFYKLPREAQELIRAYGVSKPATKPDHFRFEIAEYRWDEINAAINVLPVPRS